MLAFLDVDFLGWVLKIQHQHRSSNLEDLGQANMRTQSIVNRPLICASQTPTSGPRMCASQTPDFHYGSTPEPKPLIGGLAGSMPDSTRTAGSTHACCTRFGLLTKPMHRTLSSKLNVILPARDLKRLQNKTVREHAPVQATGVCLVRDWQRPANSRGISELCTGLTSQGCAICAVARTTQAP